MNHVLLLTDKLITGGAEMYFCKLENHLKDENMTFYSSAAPGELYDYLRHKQSFIALSLRNHFKNMMILAKEVTKLKINVIHANSLRMLLMSIAVKKITDRKIKLVYTKHNVTILEKKLPSYFRNLLNKQVDQVIAVSRFEKENLLELGVKKELIRTIYNGVDINQFAFRPKPSNETFRVGILARLSQEKNHKLFLKIAHSLKNVSDLMFYIGGDGPELVHLEEMINDLNLQNRVKLLGNISDPYQFICNMDLLLLTSQREVFPMVVLEAMASGTPMVSVDVGGIKEAIVDRETGILISQHSAQEFVKQIMILLQDVNLRNCLSYNARQKVASTFSLEKMINSTLETYRQILITH